MGTWDQLGQALPNAFRMRHLVEITIVKDYDFFCRVLKIMADTKEAFFAPDLPFFIYCKSSLYHGC